MNYEKKIAVAIDGPAGAGKSSIAKAVSKKLGYVYIDTGAMYRAVGLYALNNNIDPCDADGMLTAALEKINVEIKNECDTQKIYLNGKDVTSDIRTPSASRAASDAATVKTVRQKLVQMQRQMAKNANVIMDGRDIATAVLPDAEVKIFLTASARNRAQRRYDELLKKGENADFDSVLRDITERDRNDSERKESPLTVAKDAQVIDNSDMDFEQSVEFVYDFIKEKINNR